MRIRKVDNDKQLELTRVSFINRHNYVKGNFEYSVFVSTDHNSEYNNIIKVCKEDLKSEYFEIEYFEIV